MDYDYDVDDDYGGRILWGRVAFFGVGLLLAFLLGRCAASGVPQSEVEQRDAEIRELSEEVTRLQGEVEALRIGGGPVQTQTEEPTATGTETPTSDGTGTDAPQTAEGARTYTVKDGDTLYTIAQELYGDGSKYTLIVEANGLSEDNPLREGQVLQIPPDPEAT